MKEIQDLRSQQSSSGKKLVRQNLDGKENDPEPRTVCSKKPRTLETDLEGKHNNKLRKRRFDSVSNKDEQLVCRDFLSIFERPPNSTADEKKEISEGEGKEEVSTELKLSFDCWGTSTKKVKISNRRIKNLEQELKQRSPNHGSWTIKKQLKKCDTGFMSRLHLPAESARRHVLAVWDADAVSKIKGGVPVNGWDCDTLSLHELVFKQFNNSENVLMTNWRIDFVKRRNLKEGDEIGLSWDPNRKRLNFCVLDRHSILKKRLAA